MPFTRRSAFLFCGAELVLYLWFLWLDLFRAGAGSIPVKYASIVLCFAFTLYVAFQGGDRLTAAAMAFTLGADTFLLLLDRSYETGVVLFCIVQGLYLRRLYLVCGRALWPERLILSVLFCVGLGVLERLTPLNILVLLYFANFLCNVRLSLSQSGVRARQFAAGLILYLCCDVCVGGFNAPELLPEGLAEPLRVGMWLFYLPGQTLLALSAQPEPPAVSRGEAYDENQ